jgi:hypothetical protein
MQFHRAQHLALNHALRLPSGSGLLILGRSDWRALEWIEDDASKLIQLEFAFLSTYPPSSFGKYDDGRRSGLKNRLERHSPHE